LERRSTDGKADLRAFSLVLESHDRASMLIQKRSTSPRVIPYAAAVDSLKAPDPNGRLEKRK
jgi:hypothetical protein